MQLQKRIYQIQTDLLTAQTQAEETNNKLELTNKSLQTVSELYKDPRVSLITNVYRQNDSTIYSLHWIFSVAVFEKSDFPCVNNSAIHVLFLRRKCELSTV